MNYKGHTVETLTFAKKKIIDDATKPFDAFSEGPFKNTLARMEGVFKKEIVNYKVQNGLLLKETSVRTFTPDGKDYNDVVTIETLYNIDK